jgi:hypothetical protein
MNKHIPSWCRDIINMYIELYGKQNVFWKIANDNSLVDIVITTRNKEIHITCIRNAWGSVICRKTQ